MKPRKQLLCRLQNLPWLLPTHKSQPGSENVPQCQGGHHGCADGASWGRGFPQGCCGAPAAVQRAQRACRCHCTGRERHSGMPQKAAAQDSPPLPDLCHSIMGKRLVGAQGQCAWSLYPSPTVPQSHPRPLLEVLHVGSGPSISTACGDGLINGEQLHKSPKTFHVVEGEELTLGGKCLLKKLTQKRPTPQK